MLAHDAVFFCRVVVILFSFSLRESNQMSSNQKWMISKKLTLVSANEYNWLDLHRKKVIKISWKSRENENENERKKDEKPSSFSSCSSSAASPSKVPFHPPRALRKSAISRVKKVKKRKANYSWKKFSPFVFRVSKWMLFPLFSSEKVKPCVPLHDALIHTASLSVVVVLYHPYF